MHCFHQQLKAKQDETIKHSRCVKVQTAREKLKRFSQRVRKHWELNAQTFKNIFLSDFLHRHDWVSICNTHLFEGEMGCCNWLAAVARCHRSPLGVGTGAAWPYFGAGPQQAWLSKTGQIQRGLVWLGMTKMVGGKTPMVITWSLSQVEIRGTCFWYFCNGFIFQPRLLLGN